MVSVLITGANRGIGLGLTRHLLSEPSVSTVIASVRDVDSAKELKALSSPKLHIIQLEVVNEESIAAAAKKVAEIVGEKGLDILINNAGIGYVTPLNADNISKAKILENLEVNTVAPLLIANKFYPLLKSASSKKGSAQIANISSALGSLEDVPTVGSAMKCTVYGMTKSALNMLTRRIAVEWKDDKIRATSFCPGWVKTDMGSQAATYTVDESTIPLSKLILALTEEHNGNFYHHTGEKIPW
ncbi:hypothetical protein PMAYCL1PPCAC_32741 [Pristionchus mayeri]|uniref:Dehydrogenase n=1 Tax=Pristionchus mayeri TaxID=1317129 RepID=A0AAN5DGL1_9BILA|nr:hypothetical protein PMAYCL1PPCAC_32741 [Pristionchus mayeri]